ncbi:DEAD/DEAH box helicase family protein [Vibrio sp. 99-8-1]|uniref:DEAD/DEAH box helicase family protein n=1 Tax=Vibrio sp. 99-8-1 TaxID=2607602 RepID=UPI001493CBE1|nr:DEAD/DEAH box helicase family protein [Vibrio sp. 99-8-1]NOI66463.1 DEAD/DEAH box helicase [Vibrio sp. 99-8-1]
MANVPFPHRLVLNRYFLHLFGVDVYDLDIDPFREATKLLLDESLEGLEEDGSSRYYGELVKLLSDNSSISPEMLLEYDENIQRHTAQINEKRTTNIQWKYFQYLTLLFTELYLDQYFRSPKDLLSDLNAHVDRFNSALSEWGEKKKDLIKPYESTDLNKLAFWNATGSGKTLLMHINMQQYLHYVKKYRKEHELNRVVVLTPNEGLTHQHLDEFRISNIAAAEFSKVKNNSDMYSADIIDVIDMNKLREEGKKKTVSVDQFEQNNLVLIDEGHRGAKGDVWSEMRSRLAKEGFTFEYSATLGQAVSSKAALAEEYAKNILFDYSYRYFHADGFGKDYQILNLDSDVETHAEQENRQLYLTACLLAFYQQNRVFRERGAKYKAFAIDKPLWVFVGSKVTAVRKEKGREVSDVVDILLFLAEFVREKDKSIDSLNKLLSGNTSLLNKKGKDIFAESFNYLVETRDDGTALFKDILTNLFNAPSGGLLHVDYLKGGDGELALRLGGSEENFGVVNVGDAKKVAELCAAHEELAVSEKSFNSSIFKSINKNDSTINLLIGSKRFSEGWNSYRVSTLGLMHVGKSEGSEIIQLFGRGVRLRGFEHSLKRSKAIHWSTKDQELTWIAKDEDLPVLETLNVFGVKADYMAQFDQFLEGEGIKKPDDFETKIIPVKVKLPKTPLITVKVPDNINFKKDKKTTLLAPPDFVANERKLPDVTLDWYPRVASKSSSGVRVTRHDTDLDRCSLTAKHLAFIDLDAVYKSLQQMKAERNWYNLNLSREAIRLTLEDSSWYTLYIPKERMGFDRFDRVFEWQELAVALLKKYCDRFYKSEQDAYEAPFRKFAELDPSDPNFFEEYKLVIEQSEKLILQRVGELQEHIRNGTVTDFNIAGKGDAVFFANHLYSPMLHLKSGVDSDLFKITPTHLNQGEFDFVSDLRTFYQGSPSILEGREIYLLRNQSRGRGVGFFEAGNFYPDFILWIIDGDKQHIVFVDPKGILRCEGINDPKLQFFETIKDLEGKMRSDGLQHSDKVEMHSFIVANTPLSKVRWWNEKLTGVNEFASRNVLFQYDDPTGYIEKLFNKVLID